MTNPIDFTNVNALNGDIFGDWGLGDGLNTVESTLLSGTSVPGTTASASASVKAVSKSTSTTAPASNTMYYVVAGMFVLLVLLYFMLKH